jgi:ribokinase
MSKVVVFGSYVMDLTCLAPHIPVVGETVFSGPFKMGPGGKGFNQAVAARMGGVNVEFMTKIGKDLFNSYVKDAFDKFKISKKYLLESEKTGTGVALIVVNENNGANAIAVAPEACNELTPDEVKNNSGMFDDSKVFLTQFESNLQATNEAINIASEKGLLVVLNPAPVKEFDMKMLQKVNIIIPNEVEASQITGIQVKDRKSAKEASDKLKEYVDTVIITLGDNGVYCEKVSEEILPVCSVKTIDTTGAGDAFAGIFSAYMAKGKNLETSIKYAMAGAAISTTRFGTSPSMPEENEIEKFYRESFGVI